MHIKTIISFEWNNLHIISTVLIRQSLFLYKIIIIIFNEL